MNMKLRKEMNLLIIESFKMVGAKQNSNARGDFIFIYKNSQGLVCKKNDEKMFSNRLSQLKKRAGYYMGIQELVALENYLDIELVERMAEIARIELSDNDS